MVDRYFFPKFGINRLTFSEKTGFTDGRMDDGRTTDACVTTVALLAVAQSRAKNGGTVSELQV